jgi:hypothetical protein
MTKCPGTVRLKWTLAADTSRVRQERDFRQVSGPSVRPCPGVRTDGQVSAEWPPEPDTGAICPFLAVTGSRFSALRLFRASAERLTAIARDISQRMLAQSLEEREIRKKKTNKGYAYLGYTLKSALPRVAYE